MGRCRFFFFFFFGRKLKQTEIVLFQLGSRRRREEDREDTAVNFTKTNKKSCSFRHLHHLAVTALFAGGRSVSSTARDTAALLSAAPRTTSSATATTARSHGHLSVAEEGSCLPPLHRLRVPLTKGTQSRFLGLHSGVDQRRFPLTDCRIATGGEEDRWSEGVLRG